MLLVTLCAVLVTVLALFVSFGFADVAEFVCVLFEHLDNKAIVVVVTCVAGPLAGSSLLLTLHSWALVLLKNWRSAQVGLYARWLFVYIRLAADRFRWNLAPVEEPGDHQDECSQTTDVPFLSSADVGRTNTSSLGPQSKVEEPVPPVKRATLRKVKPRTRFDRVSRQRLRELREQQARRVIGPVVEELKHCWNQNTETSLINAEEAIAAPPSPDTSSTTLETTLQTPETTFVTLETTSATPDTTLDTSCTALSTPVTTAYRSEYLGLSLKPLWKSEASESSKEAKVPSESGGVVCEPEDDDSDDCKNEDEDKEGSKEGDEEKEEEREGGSEEGEGLEEGKEGEETEESSEAEEVGLAEAHEESEENEEVGETEGGEEEDGGTDSGALESDQASPFGGEGSVPVLNEEPSTVLAGDSVPAPADIPASTDAAPAISEAPAVMEAARMAEEGQVVEQEQAPIGNEEPLSVAHGEPATATVDTPGAMNDLSGSTTPGTLESRKRPLDEDTTGTRKRARFIAPSFLVGCWADVTVDFLAPSGGVASNSTDKQSEVPQTEPAATSPGEAPQKSDTSESNSPSNQPADVSKLQDPVQAPNYVPGSQHVLTTGSLHAAGPITSAQATTEPAAQYLEPHANEEQAVDGHAALVPALAAPIQPAISAAQPGTPSNALVPVEPQTQTVAMSATGLVPTSSHVPESHVDQNLLAAAFQSGYQDAISQFQAGFQAAIDQHQAALQAHGAQAMEGHVYQQIGAPVAVEGNTGHDGSVEPMVWDEAQPLAVSEQAQATTDTEEAEEVMVEYELFETAGMEVLEEEEQPQTAAEQATGPGVPPPVSSLAPAPGPGPTTSPTRGSRASVFKDKPEPEESWRKYAVRSPFPRKALRKTRTTHVDTSHVSYYRRMGRRTTLKAVSRAVFPDREATGYVPQYTPPDVPASWTSISTGAVEASALGTQQTAVAEVEDVSHTQVDAPAVGQPNNGHTAEDELVQMFSSAMESTQNAMAEHEATVDPAAHGPTPAPTPDPLPFPLSPATNPTPATAAPPQRGSRVLACRDKRKRRRPYDGVRPVLPRKALEKTRATTATQVDTSHVSHQGQIGWQAALESVFQRLFPDWEATGYVPQYEIPHPPVSWTPVSTETAEARQTGVTEATAATHDEASAPT
ncbi:hypothetical protein FRC07_008421, partial [Ceratobasidium sp. 392]